MGVGSREWRKKHLKPTPRPTHHKPPEVALNPMTRTTVPFPKNAVIDARVSERMRHIRSKDSKPELRVRQMLHRMGYRFRLHRRSLPGTPDIVLPRFKLAVFVHGCFWHQHEGCRHSKIPKLRVDYWLPKLTRTQKRDKEARAQLDELGWRSLVVWECETVSLDNLGAMLSEAITAAPSSRP